MKKFCRLLTVILCLPLILGIFGCNDDGDSADFYYFNTQISVVVYKGKLTEEVKNKIDDLLDGLEKNYSVSKPQSFTNRFNGMQVGQTISVSDQTVELLEKADYCYKFSDGKFNPCVYPFVRLWQFSPQFPVSDFTPPTETQINALLEKGVDFSNAYELDGNLLTKTADVEIDLGGILKGFAGDMIEKILKTNGYKDGFVNVGGSSLSLLNVSSLDIVHPRKNTQIISVINNLNGTTVSTSGDYQRYYFYDGVRYSHLINPQNGYPANSGIQSATVICPEKEGGFADALSTALCVCSYQTDNDTITPLVNKVLTTYPNAQIYVVYEKDGVKTVLTNKKKGVDFTLLDDDYSVTVIG